jgi:hypothetical protein
MLPTLAALVPSFRRHLLAGNKSPRTVTTYLAASSQARNRPTRPPSRATHWCVSTGQKPANACTSGSNPDEAKGAERTPRWVLPAQCSTWMGVLDKSRHPAYIPPVA